MPFSAEALAYARRLALAEGRHVDERRALAELLDRWDAGLVRHPAERRMADPRFGAARRPPGRRPGPGRGGRRPALGRRRDRQRTRRQARTARWPAAMTTAPASWTRATTTTPTRSRCCRDRRRGVHRRGTRLEPLGEGRVVRDGRGPAPDPAAAAGGGGDRGAPAGRAAPL